MSAVVLAGGCSRVIQDTREHMACYYETRYLQEKYEYTECRSKTDDSGATVERCDKIATYPRREAYDECLARIKSEMKRTESGVMDE